MEHCVKDFEVNTVPANDYFGLVKGPYDRKQNSNEQNGLDVDVYVCVLCFVF